MITKLVMTTTRLRSLSVFHDDRDKWLSETAAIAWIIHTKPTLRELFISNSRKDADDKHRHHPTLFRALNEQLRNSHLEKFAVRGACLDQTGVFLAVFAGWERPGWGELGVSAIFELESPWSCCSILFPAGGLCGGESLLCLV